jgi:esterase/lipase superfamily enzyme
MPKTRRASVWLAMVGFVLLAFEAGCVTRQHEIIIPQGGRTIDVAGTDKVDMLVMSTRARSSVPGAIYTGERARERSLYNLVVSIPPDKFRTFGEVQWPKGLTAMRAPIS